MKHTKKYAFSMTKHAHDLFYRYNTVKNLYEDWDPEYTSAEDYEESERLYNLMTELQELLSKGGGVVWLTGKEYGLAKKNSFMGRRYETRKEIITWQKEMILKSASAIMQPA